MIFMRSMKKQKGEGNMVLLYYEQLSHVKRKKNGRIRYGRNRRG